MFSKKKKPDAKAETAAPAAPASPGVGTASGENAAAPPDAISSPAPAPQSMEDSQSQEAPPSGGLLASGLGSKAAKPAGTPGIAASRLGGRPPSRQSAPAPEPAPPPPPAPEPTPSLSPVSTFSAPQTPSIPFGASPTNQGFSGTGQSMSTVGPMDGELSKSGRMMAMAGLPQEVMAEETTPEGKGKGKGGKNPYKPNLAHDVLMPICLCVVLCGAFAGTTLQVKDKHAIYGYTDAEKQTQVRDQYLASAKVMDDVKKMEPLTKLEAGDTAGALALAKDLGMKALRNADQKGMGVVQKGDQKPPSKDELEGEEGTVKDLLAAGMVMSKVGNKAEKELGLTYMNKAEEIATYSKYVRLMFARELLRQHRDDEAISQYENITKLFLDTWPLPHKDLDQLYMRVNRGADAVVELKELIKTDNTDPSYQRQLGLAMAQNGDQQAGFEEFQKGFTHEQDVYSYPAAVKVLVDAHGGLVDATLADIKKQAGEKPPGHQTATLIWPGWKLPPRNTKMPAMLWKLLAKLRS